MVVTPHKPLPGDRHSQIDSDLESTGNHSCDMPLISDLCLRDLFSSSGPSDAGWILRLHRFCHVAHEIPIADRVTGIDSSLDANLDSPMPATKS